jgi:glycine dehydrogenase
MNTAEKMNKTLDKTETKSKLNDLSYFIRRHIGLTETEVSNMLDKLGFKNLDAFIEALLPDQIKMQSDFVLKSFEEPLTEEEALAKISKYAKLNKVHKSYIGQGYYNTHTPGVILRNVFENPGWYTQYTPYQPEISQGRLEALLNYQTLVCDLTGLEIANASLLDEGTAAAEAMVMAHSIVSKKVKAADTILVSDKCHPQTIAVVCTRAQAYGLKVKVVSNIEENYCDKSFAAIIQYPDTYGEITNFKNLADSIHNKKGLLICATDLLALTLLEAPGKLGADIALGNSQRFGVPLGFGGPHAAFFSCKDEFKRLIPGRLVGVSKDVDGKNALRLALQTREQHIRREKATSNICTAQVLLANIAGMYAVYHGPEGLKNIARRVTNFTSVLAKTLKINEINILNNSFFDTLTIEQDEVNIQAILKRASEKNINLCILDSTKISISIDETTTNEDIKDLFYVFTGSNSSRRKPGI